jgi:hypothetical protein
VPQRGALRPHRLDRAGSAASTAGVRSSPRSIDSGTSPRRISRPGGCPASGRRRSGRRPPPGERSASAERRAPPPRPRAAPASPGPSERMASTMSTVSAASSVGSSASPSVPPSRTRPRAGRYRSRSRITAATPRPSSRQMTLPSPRTRSASPPDIRRASLPSPSFSGRPRTRRGEELVAGEHRIQLPVRSIFEVSRAL